MKILVDRELIIEIKETLLSTYTEHGNEDVFNLSQKLCILLEANFELYTYKKPQFLTSYSSTGDK